MGVRTHKEIEVGDHFERLVVLCRSTRPARYPHFYWDCQCDCGNFKTVSDNKLKSREVRSCGCLRREVSAARMKVAARKHGEAAHGRETVEFQTWSSRISACSNPKSIGYENYGGRGIQVCEGYRLSYSRFLKDVGRRPSDEHSIDRTNNNGHYSCGTCNQCLANDWPFNLRWATRVQQARNRRDNHLLTIDGETMCLSAWEERHGLPKRILSRRLKYNWPTDRLFIPSSRNAAQSESESKPASSTSSTTTTKATSATTTN